MSWFSVAYEFDVRAFRCSTAALALVALQHVIFFVWNFETILGEVGLVPPGARAGLGPPSSRTAIPNYFFLLNHLGESTQRLVAKLALVLPSELEESEVVCSERSTM